MALRVYQNVFRLHVSVNDLFLMQQIQGSNKLC
jgi:hypothetical protein